MSSSLLAIVAGSDTTSFVLSNLFYYLLSHPEYFQRLRAAIDQVFPPSDLNETINPQKLNDLPFLNAVMCVFVRWFFKACLIFPFFMQEMRPSGYNHLFLPAFSALQLWEAVEKPLAICTHIIQYHRYLSADSSNPGIFPKALQSSYRHTSCIEVRNTFLPTLGNSGRRDGSAKTLMLLWIGRLSSLSLPVLQIVPENRWR